MNKFKLGDVVREKIGGPKMTINEYEKRGYRCLWFEGARLSESSFPGESLEIAKPGLVPLTPMV